MIDLKGPKDIRELIRQWILQKRLDRLEPLPTEPDIESLVLTSLKDSDIELLAELTSFFPKESRGLPDPDVFEET
jgi:hypothetical protein